MTVLEAMWTWLLSPRGDARPGAGPGVGLGEGPGEGPCVGLGEGPGVGPSAGPAHQQRISGNIKEEHNALDMEDAQRSQHTGPHLLGMSLTAGSSPMLMLGKG